MINCVVEVVDGVTVVATCVEVVDGVTVVATCDGGGLMAVTPTLLLGSLVADALNDYLAGRDVFVVSYGGAPPFVAPMSNKDLNDFIRYRRCAVEVTRVEFDEWSR